MRLLIAFIAVPLIEIGLFIQVGDAIGLWPTLLIVLLTAIVGTALVRSQGTQVVHALRVSEGEHAFGKQKASNLIWALAGTGCQMFSNAIFNPLDTVFQTYMSLFD